MMWLFSKERKENCLLMSFVGNIKKNISCAKMNRKGLKASVYRTLSV